MPKYDLKEIYSLIARFKSIHAFFRDQYGVDDILSNSKLFEIIVANAINHKPIPGHSGSRDAKDTYDNEFEYKHFKETSSNHSWTFNDYSDSTIEKMKDYTLIFAHINDADYDFPGVLDWF